MVIPLLKKLGLESLFKNLRPVSNLAYISKLTERAVFNQIYDHFVRSGLYPQLQYAYRRYHNTEKALVKVTNDILLNMNSQRVTLLVLLDLRGAFDTVDNAILLKRLTADFGIGGKVSEWFSSYLSGRSQRVLFEGATSDSFDLRFGVPQGRCLGPLLFVVYASKLFEIVQDHLPNAHCFADHAILLKRLTADFGIGGKVSEWFSSYLSGRSQRVLFEGATSDSFDLRFGVPQGRCLGPLLFVVYASKLFEIVQDHLPNAHCFADDTQLYLSFDPNSPLDQAMALEAMERCIGDLRKWMYRDKLSNYSLLDVAASH